MTPTWNGSARPAGAFTLAGARSADLPAIRALVATHALRGLLLRRAPGEIEAHLSRWIVARASGDVVGCVALEPHRPGLWEVRSLAVADGCQGFGIGSALIEAAMDEGRQTVPSLFALTCEGALFGRLGFAKVPDLRAGDAFLGRRLRPGYQVVLAQIAAAHPIHQRPWPAATGQPAAPLRSTVHEHLALAR